MYRLLTETSPKVVDDERKPTNQEYLELHGPDSIDIPCHVIPKEANKWLSRYFVDMCVLTHNTDWDGLDALCNSMKQKSLRNSDIAPCLALFRVQRHFLTALGQTEDKRLKIYQDACQELNRGLELAQEAASAPILEVGLLSEMASFLYYSGQHDYAKYLREQAIQLSNDTPATWVSANNLSLYARHILVCADSKVQCDLPDETRWKNAEFYLTKACEQNVKWVANSNEDLKYDETVTKSFYLRSCTQLIFVLLRSYSVNSFFPRESPFVPAENIRKAKNLIKEIKKNLHVMPFRLHMVFNFIKADYYIRMAMAIYDVNKATEFLHMARKCVDRNVNSVHKYSEPTLQTDIVETSHRYYCYIEEELQTGGVQSDLLDEKNTDNTVPKVREYLSETQPRAEISTGTFQEDSQDITGTFPKVREDSTKVFTWDNMVQTKPKVREEWIETVMDINGGTTESESEDSMETIPKISA